MKTRFDADRIDWRIIELLQRDARMTNTEIGKIVGLSQSAVTSRIRQMEEAGIIEGYTTRVNARALGQQITAIIRLKTAHDQLDQCLKIFDRTPEILEAYRITGDDCFIIKATFAYMQELEATIDALARFGTVTTSLVLASYKPKPLVAPAASGKPA